MCCIQNPRCTIDFYLFRHLQSIFLSKYYISKVKSQLIWNIHLNTSNVLIQTLTGHKFCWIFVRTLFQNIYSISRWSLALFLPIFLHFSCKNSRIYGGHIKLIILTFPFLWQQYQEKYRKIYFPLWKNVEKFKRNQIFVNKITFIKIQIMTTSLLFKN